MKTQETTEQIEKNRKNIENWFKNRFEKERKLKEYKGIIQGSHVDVNFSSIKTRKWQGKTRKWQGIDQLLVIAIIPENNTFIGLSGSMDMCQAPISIIQK